MSEHFAQALENPETHQLAQDQVVENMLRYHHRGLPEQVLQENMREWGEMCDLCEARARLKPGDTPQRPPYPFLHLLDNFVDEWTNPNLSIGGLESLRPHDTIVNGIEEWIEKALQKKVRMRSKKLWSLIYCSKSACYTLKGGVVK